MKVIIAKDYQEMSQISANIIQELIVEKPDAVLGLATGGTPVGMYEQLIEKNHKGEMDFSKVRTVNLDEYLGLGGSHVQSYRYFMNEKLFNHININKENTYVPCGVAEDMQLEAKHYDGRIESMGGIDLQVLGIGNNGHVAFNEPDTFLNMNTHVVKLTADTIEANARFFNSQDEVPTKAITMGIGQIMKARQIILLASGKGKAEAIKGLLSGKVTTSNPASFLQLHDHVTLIIDEEIKKALDEEQNESCNKIAG